MTTITKIHAREILDSRGNSTMEAEVTLERGDVDRASARSGLSISGVEAIKLCNGDMCAEIDQASALPRLF